MMGRKGMVFRSGREAGVLEETPDGYVFTAVDSLDEFHEKRESVLRLVKRSFLSNEAKKDYSERFEDRLIAIAD